MKNVLLVIILVSLAFLFSNEVLAYNEFDLYLDYMHSGRTEYGNDSTDYNLVVVGANYLSDANFLTGIEFGSGSSAAYNVLPETSQQFVNLKFGFRVLNKEKYKLDPVVSVFLLTDKNNIAKIDVTGTLIGPEFKYLITKIFN